MPDGPTRITHLASLAAAAAIAAPGCGSDSDSNGHPGHERVTPETGLGEIKQVRRGLTPALAQYRRGDADVAERTVGDAYLEHFELVEVPLAKAEPQLNEDLEVLIRERLRGAIAASESPKRVAALVREARVGLTDAEQALGKAG